MVELLIAFLWRIGGAGWKPFEKNWRRIVVPLVILTTLLISGAGVIHSILIAAFLLAALRLPLTLIGSEINSPLNFLWVWISGLVLGIPSLIAHGWTWMVILPMLAQGISVTLSNISKTARDWPHEACEVLIGYSVALSILS